MTLPKINPTTTESWKLLENCSKEEDIKALFKSNINRANDFSISFEDFRLDFSKNMISKNVMGLLLNLAEECHLKKAIQSQFDGLEINETEGRKVLHTAIRSFENSTPNYDQVLEDRKKLKDFTEQVLGGKLKGSTGKTFTDVVNIGIGGSDLGPVMVVEALKFYKTSLNVHFISNVDGDHVNEVIKTLDPETTLFIVVSKTFTTQETLSNANTVKSWFSKKLGSENIKNHFAAVSTNLSAIEEFGINPEFVFPMYDYVGGRFSLWSSVGISICLAIGYENFENLLKGAFKMDNHFKNEPFEKNIPVVLALLSVWYNNFHGSETHAIIPYSEYLKYLPSYLQQAIMESNGKSVDRNGEKVSYQTGNIIWGSTGTNSQHAFFQLIHQGTKLIPCDFIGFKKSLFQNEDHHNKLLSNFIGQTEALLNGKSIEQVVSESKSSNDEKIPAFKTFDGNKPTNTILIDKLTPESMGKLISMYEHKIFVEGIIWNIFSYDQWGVELGKKMAKSLLHEIESGSIKDHDSSTKSILKKLK